MDMVSHTLREVALADVTPDALHHVQADGLDIVRRKCGKGFAYQHNGKPVRDHMTLARIKALVVPPAWREVRIASDSFAHLQAIGRDPAGRIQHLYHPAWEGVREARKAERLKRMGTALPRIREAVEKQLRRRACDRDFVCAAAIALIDACAIRAGHESYARAKGGRGCATLRKKDVVVSGQTIALHFFGKGGKDIQLSVRNPRITAAIKRMLASPGARAFRYQDASGQWQNLTAKDINQALALWGNAAITAKDFRTFTASSAAISLLAKAHPTSDTARKRDLAAAFRHVSTLLVNTPAVVKRSYVHSVVVDAFMDDGLSETLLKGTPRRGLSTEETALMRLIGHGTAH